MFCKSKLNTHGWVFEIFPRTTFYTGGTEDREDFDKVASTVAQNIYADWKKENLLKFNQPAK